MITRIVITREITIVTITYTYTYSLYTNHTHTAANAYILSIWIYIYTYIHIYIYVYAYVNIHVPRNKSCHIMDLSSPSCSAKPSPSWLVKGMDPARQGNPNEVLGLGVIPMTIPNIHKWWYVYIYVYTYIRNI